MLRNSISAKIYSCHFAAVTMSLASFVTAEELPAITSLANFSVEYSVPEKPYVVLEAGEVTAVVVDNRAVDDEVLPGHRAGYNGVAALSHSRRKENLFVTSYAGLNLEHVHDGTVKDRKVLFGPRNAPMELRVIDRQTAELYQRSSLHYGLESCTRYALLEDGTIEMTFECVAPEDTYEHNYIGLFWASYINQPESLDIYFKGYGKDEPPEPRWIRGVTPKHGTQATHIAADDDRQFEHDEEFPLELVFGYSDYYYSQPWYFGMSHGMTLVLMFRPEDQVRLSQSPSGGGSGNPAWDFQFFIPDYEIGKRYQFVLRAMYVPFESKEQIERVSAPHRHALGHTP